MDCTVTLTAYKKGKSTTPYDTKDVAFKPKTPLGPNPMIGYTLPSSWTGLERVDFGVAYGELIDSLTAFFLDDLRFKLDCR